MLRCQEMPEWRVEERDSEGATTQARLADRRLALQTRGEHVVDVERLIDQFVGQPHVGLAYDPFRVLDASQDPRLPDYLVDQGAFRELWTLQHTILFAEPGAGKSAHRVRLARACRIQFDGHRFFGIVFLAPDPADVGLPPDFDRFVEHLLKAAAGELLLALTYRPYAFLERPAPIRQTIRDLLDQNLPFALDHLLEQIDQAGDLTPLAEYFDPTAAILPTLPGTGAVRDFCRALGELRRAGDPLPPPRQRWRQLVDLLLGPLAYEALFILLDGVDGYPGALEDPAIGLALAAPLLERDDLWADAAVFVKAFLPISYRPELERRSPVLLTTPHRFATISWSEDLLIEVLQERVLAASAGRFSSLDAIATPGLRDTEKQIVQRLRRLLPRAVVQMAERLLTEHVRRMGAVGRLEAEDLDRALAALGNGNQQTHVAS